jgi:integrase/recombinase XerD
MTVDLVPITGDVLPAQPDQYVRFTEDWLTNRRLSEHTRDAYRRDVRLWLDWCMARQLDPLHATFIHVNEFGRWLERDDPDTKRRAASATTIARRLSAVSSWYAFLVKLGALTANPAAAADRPKVDKDFTATVGFTEQQAAAMRAAAASGDRYLGDHCARALSDFLTVMGARVSEVCGLDAEDLSHNGKHRTVRLAMKGGKHRNRALPPGLAYSIDTYLAHRAETAGVPVDELTGPLFVTPRGDRVDRHEVYRFVQRVAKAAGMSNWKRITPHSYRHAWNTTAKARGAQLEDRQYQLGHVDPRTTGRYDRDAGNLDRDAAYLVDVATAPDTPPVTVRA